MKPLDVAIIGFGKLGLLHASVFNAIEGCRVVAICETAAQARTALRAGWPRVEIFGDHQELLRAHKPDIAVITTPTGSHVPIAGDFIDQRVAVLIEKPLSTTAMSALPLLAKLAENPVPNMVAYMQRFSAPFLKAKEIVDGGCLGKPLLFRASMYVAQVFSQGKSWRFEQKVSGGGVLITQNCHLIDLLLWIFGEVEHVSAHSRCLFSAGVEDYVHAYLSFKCGLSGYFDASWSVRHRRTLTTNIYVECEGGTLEIDDDSVHLFLEKDAGLYRAGWSHWTPPDLFEGVSFDVGGPQYTRQAEAFVSAVRQGQSPQPDIKSAIGVHDVIDAIYASAERNGMQLAPGSARRT